MDYIKEKAPPVRENRLKACSALAGHAAVWWIKQKKAALTALRDNLLRRRYAS